MHITRAICSKQICPPNSMKTSLQVHSNISENVKRIFLNILYFKNVVTKGENVF